jgi:hypothetical protein
VQRIHRVVVVAMESGNCFRSFEDPSVWKMCCKDFNIASEFCMQCKL